MRCEQVNELLYDYTKSEVDKHTSGEIKAHLGLCPACSAELEKIAGLKALFKTGMADVPARSMVKIREHMNKPAALRLFFRPALAAIAVLFIAGTLLINGIIANNRNSDLDQFLDDSYNVVDHSDSYDVIQASYTEDSAQEIF
jgi:anti-sigma factor RsiW